MRRFAAQAKQLALRAAGHLKVNQHTRHLTGPKKLSRQPNDCIIVSVIRDAEAYLPTFIEHHLNQGLKHIVLMDNGSQDQTLEIAKTYDSVTLLQCLLPFKQYKQQMRHYLADRYSFNRWCLSLDCDELFDYPGSSHLSLTDLIRYLNQHQFTAVLNQMLDLYPASKIQLRATPDYVQSHRCFEIDTITKKPIPTGLNNTVRNPNLKLHFGGVRSRVFQVDPCLSKFSLIKRNFQLTNIGSHLVSWAQIADLSCVLYHYKFLPQFAQLVEQAIEHQQYYQGSAEYKQYQKVLDQTPVLKLYSSEHSLELKGVDQLVELGFLVTSAAYRALAASPVQPDAD